MCALPYLVLWLVALAYTVDPLLTSGVCHSIEIRNKPKNLEALRGCHVVEGHVSILLMEKSKEEDFENHSLPELREITDYLMLYRVVGLRNIGQILPNLTLIRGETLFEDYAFVVYEMFHLQEIGLTSLTVISRGAVRIDRNPKLCYVQTISWDHIARWDTRKNYMGSNRNPADCPGCDDECPQGRCWSRDQCQILNKTNSGCDPLCIGGCSGPGPRACFTCSKFNVNDECVDHCPVGTYEYLNRRCISEAECFSMNRPREAMKSDIFEETPTVNRFITFNNTCIDNCPAGYEPSPDSMNCVVCQGGSCNKICMGGIVKNIVTAQSLRGCTVILGSLEISITIGKSKTISTELEENLGSIKEIMGGLKVVRSPPIVNLHFLKNLTTIHGEDGESFAINIMENQNLQELWDWDTKPNFKVLNNRIFFHYNPKLCMHHILKLIEIAGVKNVTNLEVSKQSNGDKFPCDAQTIDISVSYKTSNLIQIHIPFVEVFRFEVHYMKNPGSDVSMYEDLDQCSDDGWKTVDVSVDAHRKYYATQGLSVNLTDLEAYTQYAFFVSGYSVDKIVITSIIYRETTLPSTPSELLSVHVYSNSSSEIVISWEPPLRFNGKFEEYEITWKLIYKDESLLSLRNYCEYPMTYESEPVTVRPILQEKDPNPLLCCNKIPITIQKDGFEQLCIDFDGKKIPSSFQNLEHGQTCKSYFYNYIYHNRFKYDNSDKKTIKNQHMKKSTKLFKGDAIQNKRKSAFTKLEPKENVKHLRGNVNNFTISNVKHFQDYIVTIKACREWHPLEIELKDVYRCSKTEIVIVRIQKDEGADLIGDSIEHEVLNNTLHVRWDRPVQPNGLVLAFELEYRQIDSSTLKSVTYCVPFLEYLSNKNSYSVVNLQPGEYKFRIRTISQAGKGPYSDFIPFSVPRSFLQLELASIALLFIIIIGFLIVFSIFIYIYLDTRNHKLENIVISYSYGMWKTHYDNPLDQWELERDDIVFGSEVGFGTFGKVYHGFLRPNNIPCAIKTVSEYANIYERNTFLSEAAIMKSVSGAYHIVKLMGVVTREKPPLVVMELMELGDLRTYLISLRGKDTMTEEIKLRIAAQIADGMCFMEAKKFVHRDLAARNCLINKELTVKVGDFGMTRDIYENDYYRKGDKGLLPIRWMAPESLKDGIFTSQSDIWSYGIVLWEIQTLGEQPYRGLSNEQVLRKVMSGSLMLNVSLNTPDPLKILMKSCWRYKPSQRITFMHTVGLLEYHIDDEFKKVSYYHGEEASGIREGLPDYIDMCSAEEPLLSECTEENMNGLSDLTNQPPYKSSLELRVLNKYGFTNENTQL